jgi:type VI secretion system secreted protein VgrG
MLEDLAGDELVYQQAQKNLRRLVKQDETITVGHDREKVVAHDETEATGGNRVEETTQDRVEEVAGDRTTVARELFATHAGGDGIQQTLLSHHVRVGKDQHLIVKKTKRELDHRDLHPHVHGSRHESAGTYSLSASSQQEKVGGSHALETGLALHQKAGTALIAEGTSSVTLKGPGGFIHVGPAGVVIVGNLVMINEGGSPGSAPDAKPRPPEKPTKATPVPSSGFSEPSGRRQG